MPKAPAQRVRDSETRKREQGLVKGWAWVYPEDRSHSENALPDYVRNATRAANDQAKPRSLLRRTFEPLVRRRTERAMNQHTLMIYDPEDGELRPYPSQADQYREYHGAVAWLVNPWTGEKRNAGDVGTDPFGHLILPPGESPYAA